MDGATKVDCPSDLPRAQAQALEILASCDPKPVITLDLDHTIWPSNCYEQTSGPYESSIDGGKHGDPSDIGRPDLIYCKDRRTDTIRPFCMYPETRQILDFCAENSLVLTICSRSPEVGVVEQIMKAFGIWEWFLFPQVYYKRKTYHFRNLTEATGLKMRDFLLFDDDPTNITMCSRMGVNCCLVDKTTGLNWAAFNQGLQLYKEKLMCRQSFTEWISGSNRNSPYPNRPPSEQRSIMSLWDGDRTSGESDTWDKDKTKSRPSKFQLSINTSSNEHENGSSSAVEDQPVGISLQAVDFSRFKSHDHEGPLGYSSHPEVGMLNASNSADTVGVVAGK